MGTAGGSGVALIWAAGLVADTWVALTWAGSAALTWADSAAAPAWAAGSAEAISPVVARLSGRGLVGQHAQVRGHFGRDHFHRGRRFGFFGGGYDDRCYKYPYHTPNCYLYGY